MQSSAVGVRAPVASGAQELVDKVAVGGVHLYRIEAGFAGSCRRACVVVDDAGDLRLCKRQDGCAADGSTVSAQGPYGPAFSSTITGRSVEPLCRSCAASRPPASWIAAHKRLRGSISASSSMPVTLVAPRPRD